MGVIRRPRLLGRARVPRGSTFGGSFRELAAVGDLPWRLRRRHGIWSKVPSTSPITCRLSSAKPNRSPDSRASGMVRARPAGSRPRWRLWEAPQDLRTGTIVMDGHRAASERCWTVPSSNVPRPGSTTRRAVGQSQPRRCRDAMGTNNLRRRRSSPCRPTPRTRHRTIRDGSPGAQPLTSERRRRRSADPRPHFDGRLQAPRRCR